MRIAALEPRAQYTVEITARETGQVAYRRAFTSDDEGIIALEVFAEEGDAAGLQSVAVYDADGELAAEGEFTIQPRPQRQVSVALSPTTVAAGGSVEIGLGGLAAFDSVTAQITTADGVLIDTVLARASSNGEALLTYATPADLADGAYQVAIFVEGARLASATLNVGAVMRSEGDVTLSISPLQGPVGTRHTIDVAGLAADQAFSLIILDPAGAEEYQATPRAGAAGEFSLTISSTEDDDFGVYAVEIRSEDGISLLASASFEISAADEMDPRPPLQPKKKRRPSPTPSSQSSRSRRPLDQAISSLCATWPPTRPSTSMLSSPAHPSIQPRRLLMRAVWRGCNWSPARETSPAIIRSTSGAPAATNPPPS